jgi:hypothetical protein
MGLVGGQLGPESAVLIGVDRAVHSLVSGGSEMSHPVFSVVS